MRNNKLPENENSKIAAGVILIGVGIALLLRNMGMIFPHWLFTWPVILILVGIYNGIKYNFEHKSWFILIAIGAFFLLRNFIPEIHLEKYFLPLFFIGIGVVYILKPKNFNFGSSRKQRLISNGDKETHNYFSEVNEVDSNDTFSVNSVFSGVNRSVLSKNFKGGKITTVFGGADIDLTQCDIQGTATIILEVAFGGVKLIVPPNWIVKNETSGIFHGVEDKRFNNGSMLDSSKELILKGSCTFGGIEIKSY